MDRIEELEKEMKALMDLEMIRMKIRHQELMYWAIPRLVLVVVLIGILVWADLRFS